MPSHLVACPFCSRHVRVSEGACPFCAGALPESFRATPARRPPGARLSRGALYAFGAGTLTVAAACSSTSSSGGGEHTVQPAYGAPVTDSGADVLRAADAYGTPPVDDSGFDSGVPQLDAAYGGPALDSGGPDAADGSANALYGAPADGGFNENE